MLFRNHCLSGQDKHWNGDLIGSILVDFRSFRGQKCEKICWKPKIFLSLFRYASSSSPKLVLVMKLALVFYRPSIKLFYFWIQLLK
jgi:hypothetical protein